MYTIFNLEENTVSYTKSAAQLSGHDRLIFEKIIENEIDTQRLANERHNDAMLKKDIEIAKLQGALEVLTQTKLKENK